MRVAAKINLVVNASKNILKHIYLFLEKTKKLTLFFINDIRRESGSKKMKKVFFVDSG